MGADHLRGRTKDRFRHLSRGPGTGATSPACSHRRACRSWRDLQSGERRPAVEEEPSCRLLSPRNSDQRGAIEPHRPRPAARPGPPTCCRAIASRSGSPSARPAWPPCACCCSTSLQVSSTPGRARRRRASRARSPTTWSVVDVADFDSLDMAWCSRPRLRVAVLEFGEVIAGSPDAATHAVIAARPAVPRGGQGRRGRRECSRIRRRPTPRLLTRRRSPVWRGRCSRSPASAPATTTSQSSAARYRRPLARSSR